MAAVAVPVEPAPVSAQVAAADVRCWLDVFSTVQSARQDQGRRYATGPALALVVVAILSGCKNPSQIHAFGKARPNLIPRLGFTPPKQVRKKENRGRLHVPNEDTIKSILASISQRELNEKFALFLGRMIGPEADASVDGKALRGADEYVLSLFVHDVRQVVWQERVDGKENELKVLERSLGLILDRYPGLSLLSGDAAFCHKSVARRLIEAKRDYLLQLKSPHQTDVGLARSAFAKLRTRKPRARSGEKRGGREGRKS